MREAVKVVIEVSGGIVVNVYAGSEANPLIEAVIIDHDTARVGETQVDSLADLEMSDYQSFDGEFPREWKL